MGLNSKTLRFTLILLLLSAVAMAQKVEVWTRFETVFESAKRYSNPLYEATMRVTFVSPTGKAHAVNGFWDGGSTWKVRFMPDEKGIWKWSTECSDKSNQGLNGRQGSFESTENRSQLAIYKHGAITRRPGLYHLEYADGTPFFWTACTAWNGTLKSTDEEWSYYLSDRVRNNYNAIQFVTTQWRGGDKNSLGQVAFEGSGQISINPEFFQHLDKKIDQINEAGLVAAPVLLWALQVASGRHLSPGYFLPDPEAILLARYMVARYGAHHVVWILGGDGRYTESYEQRWKNIGRGVFGDNPPGLVALHPSGKSWIGDVYCDEGWLDIVAFQTGHDNSAQTVKWITQGPVASGWQNCPPKVFINMEPVYEEIREGIGAFEVRSASYWSLLSTPTAGITYGANGLWPWLREGEVILNHASEGENLTRWRESLALPGSVQIGYLSKFMQTLPWWTLKPAPWLLLEQPGDSIAFQYISVSMSDDGNTLLAYVPAPQEVNLHYQGDRKYEGQWFDPASNRMAKATVSTAGGVLRVSAHTGKGDRILVLKRK